MKKFIIFFILSFFPLFIIFFSFQQMIISSIKNNETTYIESKKISSEVLKYKDKIILEMNKQDLEIKYLPIILAQVQQESSGLGIDIFQASESKYGEIGKIKTVDESIEQGINIWVKLINKFKNNNIEVDINLLLQTYNFGDGYFYYIINNNYRHSKFYAQKYSNIQAKKYGWFSYGDVDYPKNVMRYVEMKKRTSYNNKNLGLPFSNYKFYISKGGRYGMRFHPILKQYKLHTGLDFAISEGTKIEAINGGVVKAIKMNGSYGNFVEIDDGKYKSRYAHLKTIYVKNGIYIQKGTIIGEVGTTGRSTGNHLHLELFINNERVDPMYFIDKKQFTNRFIKEFLINEKRN